MDLRIEPEDVAECMYADEGGCTQHDDRLVCSLWVRIGGLRMVFDDDRDALKVAGEIARRMGYAVVDRNDTYAKCPLSVAGCSPPVMLGEPDLRGGKPEREQGDVRPPNPKGSHG